MPTTPTIEFAAPNAVKAMETFPKKTQKATMRALNRAGDSGRSAMGSLIAKDMGLTAKRAKDEVRITSATMERLEVKLRASKTRLPLSRFGARQTARGVTYKIGQGGRSRIPSAFMATVRGPLPNGVVSPGHDGVFVRVGKKRLPIAERFGPSVGHVFDKYRVPVVAKMQTTFSERLTHELKFAQTEGGA